MEIDKQPTGLEPGAPWRHVNRHGVARRYTVDRTALGPPGRAVFLTCLEPRHAPVEGYVGGLAHEARVLATSLHQRPSEGRDGWLPGHTS
jgi:hypothetical protein